MGAGTTVDEEILDDHLEQREDDVMQGVLRPQCY